MAQTLVKLEGQQDDLRALVTLSSDAWSVIEENGAYYLCSQGWNAIDDLTEVNGLAHELIAVLNGAGAVFVNNFEPVRLAGVSTRRRKDGSNDTTVAAITAKARIRHGPEILAGTPDMAAWIELAGKHVDAQKALTLYGSLEHTWRNLYLILEVVEDNMGGEKAVLASKWCPAPEKLKLFKNTANNWKALGAEARHATEKWEKPSAELSLLEAKAVVRATLQAWLKGL